MPVYDVSAVAHAVDLELKQLDNLLSRNALTGVEKDGEVSRGGSTPELAVVIRICARSSRQRLAYRSGSLAACRIAGRTGRQR